MAFIAAYAAERIHASVESDTHMKTTKQNAAARGFTTNAPIVACNLPKGWMPATSLADAEFLSLPRPRERCRFSNLSRTTLCELLSSGAIKGVTIRKPGATRGKRLIVKASLGGYLHGLANANPEQSTASGNREDSK